MNVFSLKGDTVLITGGGSGPGLGMARCSVEAGAKVVLAGRRAAQLQQAVKDLGPLALATCVTRDITETEGAAELVRAAEKAAGVPISILVNNAGIHLKKTGGGNFDGGILIRLADTSSRRTCADAGGFAGNGWAQVRKHFVHRLDGYTVWHPAGDRIFCGEVGLSGHGADTGDRGLQPAGAGECHRARLDRNADVAQGARWR